jgi:gas vesicle protein
MAKTICFAGKFSISAEKSSPGGDYMADNGNFFAGLVVGSFLGFVAGILLAPAPGSETREIIADKTQTAIRETRGSVEEVSGVVKDHVTKVVDLVKDKLPEKSAGLPGEDDLSGSKDSDGVNDRSDVNVQNDVNVQQTVEGAELV